MLFHKKMTRLTWSGALTTSGTKPDERNSDSSVVYNNNMYIFGGIVAGWPQQDTHSINLATLAWSGAITTSGTKPTARYRQVSVAYDKYMYIFGGTYDAVNLFNDTHRLDLTSNAWSGELGTTGTKPTGRVTSGCCVYNNYMYVFGGYDGGFKNDVHRLNLDTLVWSGDLGPSGTPPATRSGPSAVVCSNYMYVFGGVQGANIYNDVHRLNLDTLAWSGALSPSGTPPSARYYFVACVYGRYMYIFGGNGSTGNSPHRLDTDNLVWSGALTCSGTPPADRTNHTGIIYDDGFYIFSGVSMDNNLHRLKGLM